MTFRPVALSVPATSANLGPGFDSLGVALGLRNTYSLAPSDAPGLTVEIEGEGAESLPRDHTNLVVVALRDALAADGESLPDRATLRCVQEVPAGSGMGSSSAALVGGIALAQLLVSGRNDIDRCAVFCAAAEEEGHGDNAAPAVYGGLQAVGYGADGFIARTLPIAPMRVVVCVPDVRFVTTEARAALPTAVRLGDAVGNISRTVLLTHALTTPDYALLSHCAGDRLHQPYRFPRIPGAEAVRAAAVEAGAAAVVLSGAGPGLLAFVPSGHNEVGEAMRAAFESAGVASRFWVLDVGGEGLRVHS